MEIRFLKEEELANAAGLSRFVFDNCLRPRMNFTQTISFVEEYLTESNLKAQKTEEKLLLWGVFENEQLLGVSGMQTDGLITMLYVLPQCFHRRYGTNLLETMCVYARDVLGLSQVSVNANPSWTSYFFAKRGFRNVGPKPSGQVPFVTMCASLNNLQTFKQKQVSWKVIVGAIIGCLLFATILGGGFMLWYLS